MAIEFLNADLEVYSKSPLATIHKEFMDQGCRFSEMHVGKIRGEQSYLYSYEIHPNCTPDGEEIKKDSSNGFSAEEKIIAFIHSVSGLGKEAQKNGNRQREGLST